MLSALVIVAMVATLIAGFRWPGAILAGLLFTYPAGVASNVGSLGEVYSMAALAVMIAVNGRRLLSLRVNALDIAFALLIFWACLATTWSPLGDAAPKRAAILLLSSVAPYLSARLIDPQKFTPIVRQMLYVVVLLGAVVGYALIAGHAAVVASAARLVIGTASAVGVSQPLPFALLAGLILLFRNASARQLPVFALVALCAATILYVCIQAGTRSVFVAAGAGALVALGLGALRANVGKTAMLAGSVIVLTSQILPMLPVTESLRLSIERLMLNFGGDGTVKVDASSQMRLWLYNATGDIFNQNPIFGGGNGAVLARTGWDYPHNIVLEVGAEYGLIGLAFLLALFILLFARVWRLRLEDNFAAVALGGFAAAAIMQMMISFGFSMARPLFLVSGLLAAAVFVEVRRASLASRPPAFANGAPRPQISGLT